MTLATLVWRNLWRNRARTTLTAASLAFSLFLFTTLSATADCMKSVADRAAARLRLVVHHRTTMTKLLPLAHGAKLAAIPGVRTVCGMRWLGGRLENSQEQFPSMAVDPDSFPIVFDDFELTDAELGAWSRLRSAAIVGVGLTRRIGCAPGDRIVLLGSVPPYLRMEFRVVGITHAAAYPNVFVFRLDYLVEALRADPMMPSEHDNAVNIYWLRADSAGAMESVRRAVDAAFANSPDATMTEAEESFVAQFTKMFGDIPALVRKVGLIVIVSILLVVCNTLSGAVRERMGELAVLKAMGFSAARLCALLFGEAAALGLIGSAGAIAALCVFGLSDAAGLSMPYFPIVSVSPLVAALGVATGILINLVAAAIPALRVARLSVTAALRDIG